MNFNPGMILLVAGIWNLANGILHDIFVLLQRRPFERELIHLLIDGNILIFSGIALLLCYWGYRMQQSISLWIALCVVISILCYCGLIFKILPSVVTIFIHLLALGWLIMTLKKS